MIKGLSRRRRWGEFDGVQEGTIIWQKEQRDQIQTRHPVGMSGVAWNGWSMQRKKEEAWGGPAHAWGTLSFKPDPLTCA